MTTDQPTQSSSSRSSRFRGFLPHLVAFLLTASAAACFSYFVPSRSSILPADALIIQTHGYNDKAVAALLSAGIPNLATIDTNTVHRASFPSSLLLTLRTNAVVFIAYICVLFLVKRLFK